MVVTPLKMGKRIRGKRSLKVEPPNLRVGALFTLGAGNSFVKGALIGLRIAAKFVRRRPYSSPVKS